MVLVGRGLGIPFSLSDFDHHVVASTDADIACHHGGNEGTSAIANAPAGSKITFNWAYVGLFTSRDVGII
jgi:hypothetical protein